MSQKIWLESSLYWSWLEWVDSGRVISTLSESGRLKVAKVQKCKIQECPPRPSLKAPRARTKVLMGLNGSCGGCWQWKNCHRRWVSFNLHLPAICLLLGFKDFKLNDESARIGEWGGRDLLISWVFNLTLTVSTSLGKIIAQMILQKKHWLSLVLVGLRDRWWPMTRWLPEKKDRRAPMTTDVFLQYHLGSYILARAGN